MQKQNTISMLLLSYIFFQLKFIFSENINRNLKKLNLLIVIGTISPYPNVHIVTTAQYNESIYLSFQGLNYVF